MAYAIATGVIDRRAAPGAMTGMILSPEDGTVYVTGLGNALIRLPR